MTTFEVFSIALGLGAFATSLAVFFYAYKSAKRANQLASEANRKADETNKIATEANKKIDEANEMTAKALKISLHEHRVKITPILVAGLHQIMVWIDRHEDDYIYLTIKNKTQATVKITHIELMSIFEITNIDKYPLTLQFNGKANIYLKFKKGLRSTFVTRAQNDKSIYEQDEKAGEFIEDVLKFKMLIRNEILENTTILIDYYDEIGTTYYSNLRYDESKLHFVGEPIQF